MKKILFLCLLLCGCSSTLYVNKPYAPKHPKDVVLKLREDANAPFWGKQLDENSICAANEQIAYESGLGAWPLFFVDEQNAIDDVRKNAARLGGDMASIYDLKHYWFLLFGVTEARSIVYKCNGQLNASKTRYVVPQQNKVNVRPYTR